MLFRSLAGMQQGQTFAQNNEMMGMRRQQLFNDMQKQKLEWGQMQHEAATTAAKDILSSYKLDPSGKLAQAMFGIHSPGLSKMGVDTSPFAGIFSGGNSMGEYLKGEANKQAAGEEFTKLAPHNIVPRYDFAPTKANVANSFASPQTGIIYNRLMEPPKPIK